MADTDVISLSSDSSRPSSPFIDISEVLNDSEKRESIVINFIPDDLCVDGNSSSKCNTASFSKGSPVKHQIFHALSESDESETDLAGSYTYTLNYLGEYSREKSSESHDVFTSNVLHCNDKPSTSRTALVNQNKRKTEQKNNTKMTKEQRLEEKLLKQKEKEKKKAEKDLLKQMKPGNCMKYMTVLLDSTLISCPFGGSLLNAVQNSECQCQVSTQAVPFTIHWTRDIPGSDVKKENDIVLVWQWQLVIPAIKNHTLSLQIQEIRSQYPSKTITLIVYGLNDYYSCLKSKRRNGLTENDKARKGKRSTQSQEFPCVTRKDMEEELIELQIMENCNHRFIESPEDLGQLILQITKAIAETPFKLDKQRRELDSLEWFAVGDSRDCVTVDKAGNGLLRLWQQQLCQFNLAGHDVAQAIAAVYRSPSSIVQAYNKCSSQKEAEELLKDIQVRRCQGPLSSSRRIGPELSKKIYAFFYSTDGDAPLSQEQ